MNVKKFLSGILIGAFVFGVAAGDLQTANASGVKDIVKAKEAEKNYKKIKEVKEKYDKEKNKFDLKKDKNSDDKDKLDELKDKFKK